jgi:hypothetical protein
MNHLETGPGFILGFILGFYVDFVFSTIRGLPTYGNTRIYGNKKMKHHFILG